MQKRSQQALDDKIETALAVVDDVAAEDVNDPELLMALQAPFTPEELEDPQQYLDWENPDHQNLLYRVQDLTHKAAQLLEQMTPTERKVALAAQTGARTYTAIGEKAGTTATTVSRYMRENPTVRKYLQVAGQRQALASLPAMAHRAHMAWRIAQRNEVKKPAISLKALSLLAQQAGEMQKDKDVAQAPPTVVLANFNFAAPQDQPPAQQAQPEAGQTIEDAVYTVVPPEPQE